MQRCAQRHAGVAQQQRTVEASMCSITNGGAGRMRSIAFGNSYMLQWPRKHYETRMSAGHCLLHQQQPQNRVLSAHAGPSELINSGRKKVAVYVSGGGSNFKAIHAACLKGDINADIVVRFVGLEGDCRCAASSVAIQQAVPDKRCCTLSACTYQCKSLTCQQCEGCQTCTSLGRCS